MVIDCLESVPAAAAGMASCVRAAVAAGVAAWPRCAPASAAVAG